MFTTASTATAVLFAAFAGAGCCLIPSPDDSDEGPQEQSTTATAEPAGSGLEVDSVLFARDLDDEWEPIGGAVEVFRAEETKVVARVLIDGRPRQGVLTMKWMWRDLQLATTDVNLADANAGVFFSIGEDTVIKGTLTVPFLYIGQGNRLVLAEGERELGSYSFNVLPPENAMPSRLASSTLFRGFQEGVGATNPGTEFGPNDPIFIGSIVQLGRLSWYNAKFTLNGEEVPALTLEEVAQEDRPEGPVMFRRNPPEGGWPAGTHQITLVLNDEDVGSQSFTIVAEAAPE